MANELDSYNTKYHMMLDTDRRSKYEETGWVERYS